jgi:hypothetical protein
MQREDDGGGRVNFKPMFPRKVIDAICIPQVKTQPFVSNNLVRLIQTG